MHAGKMHGDGAQFEALASSARPCHPLRMSPLLKGPGTIPVLYKDTLAHCRRQDLRHHHRKLERGDEITRVQLRDSVRVLESHATAYQALLARPRAPGEPYVFPLTREERTTLANCIGVWFANEVLEGRGELHVADAERVKGAVQGEAGTSNWT